MASQLERAMEGLIEVFHSYSSKEGDKYKLSRAEMKNLLQGELADFLTEFVVLVAALTVACNEFFVQSQQK
ncbi:hypothetical protein NHX12_001626 [Muraenolepis orangiensis]|uniref:S100/CaBP-9k-type calcium binding subdomain domain-containing protein n=1 Tax=Muraenolepis orangiensis TaxID=630683 RepID=A0A9Q0E4X2_9TELE|nr:hypothetical protein NHX12_001626 [Muraenolepis orangiensis]